MCVTCAFQLTVVKVPLHRYGQGASLIATRRSSTTSALENGKICGCTQPSPLPAGTSALHLAHEHAPFAVCTTAANPHCMPCNSQPQQEKKSAQQYYHSVFLHTRAHLMPTSSTPLLQPTHTPPAVSVLPELPSRNFQTHAAVPVAPMAVPILPR